MAEENLLKRVLPHSLEAEQSVLGAMLMDKEAVAAALDICSPDDFYSRQYGVIFESIAELFDEGKPVDMITVQAKLKEKDVPPEVAGIDFIRSIFDYSPTSANVKSYAGIVHEKAVKRRLIKVNEEIENRCYSTLCKLYQLNDTMMAGEIWKQAIAVSYVLGAKYQPHFLRTYGRAGENDLRTHTYLAQEGYLGVAGWTYNGSLMEEGRIGNNLAPGNIYYFKTTEEDLRRMNLLITEAREQEFEMVTLNELFGYEKNACKSSANVLAETMPELQDHDIPYYFMKTGDCTWATNLMQRRLTQLGYLPEGSADGVYGSGTAAALSAFQAKMGIAATGAADVETQRLLYAEDAPRSED